MSTPTTPAEILAQRQLDAYNAHDIEAFAACFADEVEAFELPSMAPILSGKAALIQRYAPYFAEKRPHAALSVPRITLGTFAIDTEHVTLANGDSRQAIALYHVEDGLIRRLWFIR